MLKLYVTGETANSKKAIENLQIVLKESGLEDKYEVEIIDILENPKLAEEEKIIATPVSVKKLQESEQRFTGIVDSITDRMSMMNRDHNILWANGVAKRLFGKDIIGRKCYDVYHRRNAPCEPCIVSKTFQDDQVHEHETEVIGADGSRMTFWCKASVTGRDQDERPIKVVEVSRDVTEWKKAEKELKRKIDELELFNEVTVDRELKMIELKKEVNELCEKYGEKPRYDVEEEIINEVK